MSKLAVWEEVWLPSRGMMAEGIWKQAEGLALSLWTVMSPLLMGTFTTWSPGSTSVNRACDSRLDPDTAQNHDTSFQAAVLCRMSQMIDKGGCFQMCDRGGRGGGV